MQIDVPRKPERTYLTVLSSIDHTGLLVPREILWPDGRRFHIDQVESWHKAPYHEPNTTCCIIRNGEQNRALYFTQSPVCSSVNMGRWYVER